MSKEDPSRPKAHRRHRRWPWIVLASLVVLVVGFRLALNPLAAWEARKQFSKLKGYRTDFTGLTIRLWKLELDIGNPKAVKDSAGGDKQPVLAIDHLRLAINARQLLHGHVVAQLSLDRPRMFFIAAPNKKEQQAEPETPHLDQVLASMVPLSMELFEVRNGEIIFIDKTNQNFPKLWLQDLQLTLENLATRPALQQNKASTLAVRATFQETGKLEVFLTADPLRKGLYFDGQAQLTHFPVTELNNIMVSKTGLKLEKGTLDAFAQLKCEGGVISGGIKPVLKNAKVGQGKPNDLGNQLEATLADAGIKLLSDRVPGRNAVATVLPISGTVKNPNADLWPTVFGVLRNAFVIAVTEGYSQLPPPQAQARQGPIQQALEALDSKKAAPKVQPPQKKEEKK